MGREQFELIYYSVINFYSVLAVPLILFCRIFQKHMYQNLLIKNNEILIEQIKNVFVIRLTKPVASYKFDDLSFIIQQISLTVRHLARFERHRRSFRKERRSFCKRSSSIPSIFSILDTSSNLHNSYYE